MLKSFMALKKGQETDPEKDLEKMSDEEFDEYLKNSYGGGNEQSETENADDETAENEDDKYSDEPYKSFATEEEYNNEFDNYVNSNYGKELSDGKENGRLIEKIKSLIRGSYGSGENSLQRFIEDLEKQNAQQDGIDVDTYRKNEEDRRELEEYRSQQKAQKEAREGRQKIIDKWNSDSERLKESVPEFVLEQAMQNEEFRNMIVKGATVPEAFYAIKYREMQPEQTRRGVRQNALSRGTKTLSGINDIMALNDRDFRSELKKIMENE